MSSIYTFGHNLDCWAHAPCMDNIHPLFCNCSIVKPNAFTSHMLGIINRTLSSA